jgi:5-(carboxyamino)imidazole ribonucleotide synthase
LQLVTYEFENVPVELARRLEQKLPVYPPPAALEASQDRLAEKTLFQRLGLPTAPFAPVQTKGDLLAALEQLGLPAVLKTRRFGYDGKGQVAIQNGTEPEAAWQEIGGQPAILESFVPFEREISVIAARARDGRVECFDVTENEHRDHILKLSRVPARVPEATAAEARRIARTIADAFDYVGVLAVEMFVVAQPGGHALLVNEIAPRVHNSGHWTIDGATASQFEQHIRAIAGWPLARPIRHGRLEMINLIGEEIKDCEKWLSVPGACVHDYGKSSIRPGRKMGHVTRFFPDGA